ncbi:1,4-dihydroxy-2-naphthoate polyprenyltransferase [Aquibacillus koreensis]|uniref:1,4-dihydroxy-2-naphthoate octaprenyltransferase n=1 Tax=Aquibacillus koreensis TaxID=279446 RepID=A0A9X4AI28_9BACI|nr:1,4-dihydroxy-2-naphthoate polyprenyltransferase [Aquibacillus koreensis]MCT2535853.1 1,4-dihydroxy-2-naphthoate polyprenyltransferase [Aquibacillus koreensis]MDC3420309.1 1,4-dihydroxy-2-naphthoate polyprenyltransferase [Aquibacillus koreensis]
MQTVENNTIKNSLNEKDGFHIWWRLLRPHTLTASFIPVFIGSMLAILDGSINYLLFLAMLIAAIMIQAATNMFNEYYDYVRGLDNENSVGIGGTIVRDGIKPKTVLILACSLFAASMLLGVYICLESNWWVCAVGLVCMLFGYLYTGGPLPIAYTPLGELFAGFLMGTMIIGISYYIQTLSIPANMVLISIPVSIFIATILLSNNIRDLDGDKENGRKTIAILIGRKNAISLLAGSFVASYIITIVLIIAGILPLWSFITLLSVGQALKAVKRFIGKSTNVEMIPAMVATAKTNTIFGALLGISLLIQIFIPFSF